MKRLALTLAIVFASHAAVAANGPAEPWELDYTLQTTWTWAASDIPDAMESSESNPVRFERRFKGQTLAAVLSLNNASRERGVVFNIPKTDGYAIVCRQQTITNHQWELVADMRTSAVTSVQGIIDAATVKPGDGDIPRFRFLYLNDCKFNLEVKP
jgi:hypothetical protein